MCSILTPSMQLPCCIFNEMPELQAARVSGKTSLHVLMRGKKRIMRPMQPRHPGRSLMVLPSAADISSALTVEEVAASMVGLIANGSVEQSDIDALVADLEQSSVAAGLNRLGGGHTGVFKGYTLQASWSCCKG
jgi:hypothetical protein